MGILEFILRGVASMLLSELTQNGWCAKCGTRAAFESLSSILARLSAREIDVLRHAVLEMVREETSKDDRLQKFDVQVPHQLALLLSCPALTVVLVLL